jgi:tetratricopeptide (TPR) repeat protein
LGNSPEAELLLERVLRVAPLDLPYRAERIVHFIFTREFERGIAEAARIREIDPEFADANIPFLYFLLGRPEDAVREMLAYLSSLGAAAAPVREAFRRASEEEGFQGGLRAVTRLQIEAVAQGAFGVKYLLTMELATIGDTEEALTWLERAYDERDPLLINAKIEPRLDSLRSDPRFHELIRRIGFPET